MAIQLPEILRVTVPFAQGVHFPSSGCRSSSLASILLHRFSPSLSLTFRILWSDLYSFLMERRHAALPVRFPFRISRRVIGCPPPVLGLLVPFLSRRMTWYFYLPLAKGGIPIGPRKTFIKRRLAYGRTKFYKLVQIGWGHSSTYNLYLFCFSRILSKQIFFFSEQVKILFKSFLSIKTGM